MFDTDNIEFEVGSGIYCQIIHIYAINSVVSLLLLKILCKITKLLSNRLLFDQTHEANYISIQIIYLTFWNYFIENLTKIK